MDKINKALYYARKQVEHASAYVWGGQGEKLAKLTVLKLAAMETSAENAARVEKYIFSHMGLFDTKTKIFDCSGLACKALIYAGVLPKGADYTAQGLYDKFPHVSISAIKPGDLIFKGEAGRITHIGIVKDPATVYEAKGRDYGCIESMIDAAWKYAARPEY